MLRRGVSAGLLLLLALLPCLLSVVKADWFTDPCEYHPHVLHQLRLRFASITGQSYATDAIYAHVQRHVESYEASLQASRAGGGDAAEAEMLRLHQGSKPLVLSFHGPTGTGKSLTASSVASVLFWKARSEHVHVYHGSDYSDESPEGVRESIRALKSEAARHARRCPLSLFVIEEIHMMAPGVLDGLKHLLDAQVGSSRVHVTRPSAGGDAAAAGTAKGKKPSTGSKGAADDLPWQEDHLDSDSGSSSVQANFAHCMWLFTTNIGSAAVQKLAYDAAKEGKQRESLSPQVMHDVLHAALTHSQQLQLLQDTLVLSALIPFFPLFKVHVKECVAVQLSFRRKIWVTTGMVASFDWDASVLAYAAGQLKYKGPISESGCKNVNEVLTQVLLSPLTKSFRRVQEDADHELAETLKDVRVRKRDKLWSWGANLLQRAKAVFTGPVWNHSHANVTMTVETDAKSGQQSVLFTLTTPITEEAHASASTVVRSDAVTVRTEVIRQPLHTSQQYHSVPESTKPAKHALLVEDDLPSAAASVDAAGKDEL